jgi:hypothetical protein
VVVANNSFVMFTRWGDFYVRRDPSECRIKVTGNSCVVLCAGL